MGKADTGVNQTGTALGRLAVIAAGNTAGNRPRVLADSWAALTGLPGHHIFEVECETGGHASAYAQALETVTATGEFDFILCTTLPAIPEQASRAHLEILLQALALHPRTAAIELVRENAPEGERDQTAFHHRSAVDIRCFIVSLAATKKAGFLSHIFPFSVGAAEEWSFRLLKKGLLTGMSSRAIADAGANCGPATQTDQKLCHEFCARYFVEHHGRDWDTVAASYLPYDLQKENGFVQARNRWQTDISDHEQALYSPTLAVPEAATGGTLGQDYFASRIFDIVRLVTAEQACELLHPWYYPVTVGSIEVDPGVGSRESSQTLIARRSFMDHILIDTVPALYDFKGKHVLDLGSNCGYFSAVYAKEGAARVTAVEGRLQHIHQGQLYWGANKLLAGSHYEFLHANVDSDRDWQAVSVRGPYDIVLCAGLLYHLPDPYTVLERMAACAKEAIILDTRISQTPHGFKEPGGFSFDAIVETRDKIVPQREELEKILTSAGFLVAEITSDNPMPPGVPDVDDYSKGNRITLLAQRKGGQS